MTKCTNCVWDGKEEETKGPLKHCPVCGDNTKAEDKTVAEEPKVENKLSKEAEAKLAEVRADLADDGKMNHSNNPAKKSPGRKKRK